MPNKSQSSPELWQTGDTLCGDLRSGSNNDNNNNDFIERGGSVGHVQSSLRSSIKNNIYKHLHINIQTYMNTNKQKSSMPKMIYLLSSADIQT